MRKFLVLGICFLAGVFICACDVKDKTEKPRISQEQAEKPPEQAPEAVNYVITGSIDAGGSAEPVPFEQIKKSAEAGDAENQFKLAELYYSGLVVKENGKETVSVDSRFVGKMINPANINYAEAKKWYKKAAKQGSEKAQKMLNSMSLFGEVKKQAEAGNAESQFKLGEMYRYGEGTIGQNRDEAMYWYEKAGEQGHIAAQNQLAYMYCHPVSRFFHEIVRGNTEGAKWYKKAADQGSKEAQYELGLMYYSGKGVEQDYIAAADCFAKAAAQGHTAAREMSDRMGNLVSEQRQKMSAFEKIKESAEAGNVQSQYELGKMYYDANGVKRDYPQAAKWYKEAAEQGYSYAQYELAIMYGAGRGVAQDLAESAKYYENAAEQGHVKAQVETGNIYFYNSNGAVVRDRATGVKWYKLAAEQGNAEAQYRLGSAYYEGEGVDQNRAEAEKWLKRAANQGYKSAQSKLNNIASIEKAKGSDDAESQYQLGNKYFYYGTGVKQDLAEAARLYKKAAEQGHVKAQYALAQMYYSSRGGVERDYGEALKWYKRAAEQGFADAQHMTGLMYYEGTGIIPQNYAEAFKWYRKAAEQGHWQALNGLADMYENGYGVEKSAEKAEIWRKKAVEAAVADAESRNAKNKKRNARIYK